MGLKIFNRRARRQELVETNHVDLVGFCMLWPGATPPAGWLFCEGGLFVGQDYPLLAAKLGTTWGPMAIGGPFGPEYELPDFRGRMVVGVGTHADVVAVAAQDVASLANRRPNHGHAAGSGHSHTANHNHAPAAAHAHNISGSHTHASANHTHTTQAHGHGVSGESGASNNNVSADAVGAGSGTETRNSAHTHNAGTLFGDNNDLGTTGGIVGSVNGGVNEPTTPGATGGGGPGTHTSGGETTSTDATADADAIDTSFLALRWVIKAVA